MIVVAGDPHGDFAPILRFCAPLRRGTLILLGDCELKAPLRDVLAPVLWAGWSVHWILGNRDTDSEQTYDNLVGLDGNLGGRVMTADGLRIAGLGGVFRPRVWLPAPDEASGRIDPPQARTREELLTQLPASERWRDGLPLRHRDTIFPEDFDRLASERFDVLVCHEAPSSHRHGFGVIDELARSAGARLIVHGHHHHSYDGQLAGGIAVRGLKIAEPWLLQFRS